MSGVSGGTILVVEDEANIADLVDMYLRKEGFRVLLATSGEDGLAAAKRERPRLVVLDVGLPGMDGLEVCRRLRAESPVPVIFLTARDSEIDRVLGLEMGADDYLTKPFSPRELVARVKAVLRRSEGGAAPPEIVQVGETTIDVGRREVRAGQRVVDLTGREFELLRYLAERRGRALSRQQILDGVWGPDWYGDARTVDVHVAQVRKKLGDAVAITTVRGLGYRLDPPS
jgi:DNA-binding response OmpR family regulator